MLLYRLLCCLSLENIVKTFELKLLNFFKNLFSLQQQKFWVQSNGSTSGMDMVLSTGECCFRRTPDVMCESDDILNPITVLLCIQS